MAVKKVNFEPCHDNILVKRDKVEEKKSPGGVVLPPSAQDVPVACTVIAVGPGRTTEKGTIEVPNFIEPGRRIVLGKYSGSEIELDGEKYSVVGWPDVLGIVKD